MEGSAWNVNYYSQMLGADDGLVSQSLQQSALHQQYTLIERFEIKVTTPLSQEQNPSTSHMEIRGSGVVYAAVVPNVGDMFIADIGDGRAGVFSVTTSLRKTMLADSYYAVDYVLKHLLTPELQDDFDRKTVSNTVFVKDYLHFGQNPKVLTEDYHALRSMDSIYSELLSLYFNDFFSNEHETLIIPGQTSVAYDPFLTKAVCDWVSTEEHPFVARIRQPSVESDQAYRCLTIWDCLGRMSIDLLPTVIQQAQLIPTDNFRGPGQYGGIYYTKIRQVVYPYDSRTDVDASYVPGVDVSTVAKDLQRAGRRYKDLNRLVDSTTMAGFELNIPIQDQLPAVVPVVIDDFYIFSEGFYRKEVGYKSKLEMYTLKALQRQKLDKSELNALAEDATRWSNLERFYYTPILLALMKTAMRTN